MATIGKTFSDPDKWESAFFARFSPGQKLLFLYLWERCDHAGVIEIVLPVWSAHIGQEITEESLNDLIAVANHDKERIVRLEGKIWFTQYIRFNQQSDPEKSLSPTYSFHRHVFQRIQEHGLTEKVQKRDPILLKDFISTSTEKTDTSKPYTRLNEGLPKSTGKEAGKGKGGGEGEGLPATNVEKATNGESKNNSISDSGIVNDLKNEIPGLALMDVGEIAFQGDADRVLEKLREDGVKEPENYLVELAEKENWNKTNWNEFVDSIIGMEEVPF